MRRCRSNLVGIVVPALCALIGCTSPPKQLPPRTPPAAQPPPIPLPPTVPPAGLGRVVLDGTDGPMRITAQADTSFVPPGASVPPTRTGELCPSTPCVADLPVGRYTLYITSADGSFAHGDTDELIVTDGLTYYRRAPGKYEPPTWIPALPVLLAVGGAVLITSGIVLATAEDTSLNTPGWVVFGGGVALLTWGGVELYDASRAKQQMGATTVWKP